MIEPKYAYSLLLKREVETSTEEWRHECECRHMAKIEYRTLRQETLAKIGRKRGDAAMIRLRDDSKTLYIVRCLWPHRRNMTPEILDEMSEAHGRNSVYKAKELLDAAEAYYAAHDAAEN